MILTVVTWLEPRHQWTERRREPFPGYSWDLSPDGRRFLVLENADSGKTLTELVVVQNFFDELRRRVPGP